MKALLADSSEATRPAASILVVDDDAVVLDALCAQIACDGWAVTACATPGDALAALRQKTYATIISDQNMPEMKGLEFLAQAREIQPAATRLLITGVLSTGTLIEAINHGEIYRFLSKPWTRAELLVAVRNAVQRHEILLLNDRLHSEVASLRLALATREAELASIRATLLAREAPPRTVNSGAGLLTQRATATQASAVRRPEESEERATHVHLVGYC